MPLNPFLFDLDDQAVLQFTILQRDQTPYNLTGTTVNMLVEGVDTFPCTITGATAGTVERTVAVGDFPQAGRYRAQLRVTGVGNIFHTDIFVIQVSESINSSLVGPLPPTLFPAVGGVLFGASGGQVSQDLTNFFWDDSLDQLQLFSSATVFKSGAIIHNGNLILSGGTVASGATTDGVNYWVADRNGAGTATQFVRTEDSGINERPLAVLVQAFDNTERSTTSTSSVDLSTLTVNIPANDGFIVTGLLRKTSGAAATISLGIKLNGTIIHTPFAVTSGTNQAEGGEFVFGIQNSSFGLIRQTNYDYGETFSTRAGPAGGALSGSSSTTPANPIPTGAITSITITGLTGNAAVTCAVKNITVFRVARA